MKRALSLVLALLMVLGSMTFVISAEDTTTYPNIPEILEANGREHIKLTTPIATPPVQDGSIGGTEYTLKLETTGYDNIYHAANSNYVYNEYFAYDANWVYYGVEATGAATLGTDPIFAVEAAKYNVAPADMGNEYFYLNWGDYIMYNRYGSGETGWEFTTTATRALAEEEMPGTYDASRTSDRWLSSWPAYTAAVANWCSIGVNKAAGQEQTVFEVKFNRNKLLSDDNVYAFYMYDYGLNSVMLYDRFYDADREALGGATGCNYSPRYIMLGYDLTEILSEDAVIKLDTPIAKAPVQDGKVKAGEYTETRVIKASNKATFDYNGQLNDNALITESFAYDADWIYYAVQAGKADPANTANTTLGSNFYFSFAPISKRLPASEIANMGNNLSYGYGDWFAYNIHGGAEYKITPKRQDMVDRINASFADIGRSDVTTKIDANITTGYGDPYPRVLYDLVGQAVNNPVAGAAQNTYEIKISRHYSYSADNTYAFALRPYAGSVNFAYKLSETEKAAFGGIVDASGGKAIEWLPRVITVADTEYSYYNFAERLSGAGGAAVLSEPIATAPVQDGKIGGTEYTVSRDVAATDVILGSGTFTEHFAYDADWVYYAIEATGGSSLGLVPTMYLSGDFAPTSGKAFYDVSYYTRFVSDRISVGWHDVNAYELEFIKADSIDLANYWTAASLPATSTNTTCRWLSTWTQQAKFLRENFLVAATSTANYAAEQTVFEVKFSRNNCFDSDNNAYAYQIRNKANSLLLCNRLDNVEKCAVETSAGYSPRFIVIEEDIITKQTASIRIDTGATEESGLRFKTDISNKFIADLRAQGYEVQVGTLIAPTDTIGVGTFTELKHEFGTAWKDYVDVIADVDNPYASGTACNTYAGSLVSIYEENIARSFSARGYVKATKGETVEYFYSDIVASRDVSTIASAAYGDYSALTDSSVYAHIVEGQTYYSPYTKEQRDVIALFIKKS